MTNERNVNRRRDLFASRLEAARDTFDCSGLWWQVARYWLRDSRATPLRDVPDLAYLSWPLTTLRQPATRESFFRWHLGRCAMCGNGNRTYVDHDHATHLIRGLLCPSCNRHEGVHFTPALEFYRLVPPAVVFGVVEFYDSRGPDMAALLEAGEEYLRTAS